MNRLFSLPWYNVGRYGNLEAEAEVMNREGEHQTVSVEVKTTSANNARGRPTVQTSVPSETPKRG